MGGNRREARASRNGSGASAAEAEPDDLVRRLLANFAQRPENPAAEAFQLEEVVLDVEVDGLRYMLVRLPAANRLPIVLSPREQEIARMVARGHQNKTIADVLNISSWTVCTHLRRIFAKLNVSSRAAMVAKLHEIETVREKSTGAQSIADTPGAHEPGLTFGRRITTPRGDHPSTVKADGRTAFSKATA